MIELIFWISLILVVYVNIGYSITVMMVAAIYKRKNKRKTDISTQKIAFLISAYNEEKVIGNKIENTLNLNTTGNEMHIIVISDGSDDATDKIVEKYSKDGVILKRYEGRIGKTQCLNRVIEEIDSDILIFSDANSQYRKDSIVHLLEELKREDIGLVTGRTIYSKNDDKTISESIGLYSKLEHLTKRYESRIGSCVGADGAIFAMRKKLYKKLDTKDINDLVIPINVVKEKYRVVFEENAICDENHAGDLSGEFKRQKRISNRAIRALIKNKDIMNPFRFGLFAYQVICHRMLRYMVPFLLILLFGSNAFLIGEDAAYLMLFMLQISIYAISIYKTKSYKNPVVEKVISSLRTFVHVNWAILCGWIIFFKGETIVNWDSQR